MSNPHLPAEMLDRVVDHLYDTKDTLRNCCLVSKSWVPRTRTHLFADISFLTEGCLESWKETFPDPSTSPAHYTKTLSISCSHVVTAIDAESGGWIRGFCRVVDLEVASHGSSAGDSFSLIPFHGLSPTIKSLRVAAPCLPSSRIFDLTLSFPLLEDLTVVIHETSVESSDEIEGGAIPTAAQPSTSPMFTGTLYLYLQGGVEPFTHRLLSIPGGIHFRKLILGLIHDDDPSSIMALMDGCSHTLESLDISADLLGTSTLPLHSHR